MVAEGEDSRGKGRTCVILCVVKTTQHTTQHVVMALVSTTVGLLYDDDDDQQPTFPTHKVILHCSSVIIIK